ncbi:mitochondrial outer membrane protein [Paraphaeosphaeria minitans]|uniref:Mitochondrial outer membrane protein n=1 Tax=Paraphaeosphaeria minitans TaxID=565426 RepID=A0A9P6GJD4_9PLEO|nr:mitochondrial outer membrane protein [Paraphaeosphaeria minitans]
MTMTAERSNQDDASHSTRRAHSTPSRSIFAVPTPIKQLFDCFPLLTYSPNDLPQRAPRHRDAHTLFVFATEQQATDGAPSYNPVCLKWQVSTQEAYLKFSGIKYRTVSSNNHASPSGVLPFLLPASTETSKPPPPVSSAKLQRWAMNNTARAVEEPGDLRSSDKKGLGKVSHLLEALRCRLIQVQLYSVYLSSNATSLAEPLYILPTSSNAFVRLLTAADLRRAAENELLKFSAIIDAAELHRQAEEAFEALETVLGNDSWFFGASQPGLFDASVFAYTHLLMDGNLGDAWVDTRLRDALLKCKNLTSHRDRIIASCFPDFGTSELLR